MRERFEERNQVSDAASLLPIDEHVEEGHDAEGHKVRYRGIYLLPNLFTTANLFAGFYSIINSMNAQGSLAAGDVASASKYFFFAAIAIFIAMVLDVLDGRVARMTNTQSTFGAEYDSLSDMVAFGVAPALLTFAWALGDMGRVGWMVAFIYVAGAALRLARFNTQVSTADKRYFIGLATPAAAGVLDGVVWAFSDYGIQGSRMSFLVALVVAAAGMLMVSNIKYSSFKQFDLKGRVPFVAILVVVLVFAVVFSDPPRILLLAFLIYATSGPIQYLLHLRRSKTLS
ncbi:CDP-diacylglycerol--serine O-phosphatidyltransferase [Candidatus Pseudomonas adelgestsugas]|uniref:CDP-diacylglycerol--serine O-phosphatidyltransferase n=1 Tax=Candidatus Pseudomonas adelgestsugas TaxID=1302376 RepID=A0ABX5R8V3_9PSED|nr:CDP-diacylglycerol--serine O-phosphatidyltransferase [Candidatus Pseudomonas adelgestsugas]QAX81741.1 CDP-alcohol phosphatidyltransferase [Candidatus Pseudomonas adelgestsugas]